MKLSKGGLILAGIYTGLFLLAQALGLLSDPKGEVLFEQISVFPAMILLSTVLGLNSLIPRDSWMNSIKFFFLVSLFMAHLGGWTIERLARAMALGWIASTIDSSSASTPTSKRWSVLPAGL